METTNYTKSRIYLTSIASIIILGLLIWQHYHNGVPSHHILNKENLPEISNWWGAIWIPILTWFLSGRIVNRIKKQKLLAHQHKNQYLKIYGLFLLGIIFGLSVALSFTYDFKLLLDNIIYIFLFLSLFVPIFYAEFILGFIFGMTYTFGAILPTAFILIITGLGFLIYRFIRPLILRVVKIKLDK